jgi:hypothetical protein
MGNGTIIVDKRSLEGLRLFEFASGRSHQRQRHGGPRAFVAAGGSAPIEAARDFLEAGSA